MTTFSDLAKEGEQLGKKLVVMTPTMIKETLKKRMGTIEGIPAQGVFLATAASSAFNDHEGRKKSEAVRMVFFYELAKAQHLLTQTFMDPALAHNEQAMIDAAKKSPSLLSDMRGAYGVAIVGKVLQEAKIEIHLTEGELDFRYKTDLVFNAPNQVGFCVQVKTKVGIQTATVLTMDDAIRRGDSREFHAIMRATDRFNENETQRGWTWKPAFVTVALPPIPCAVNDEHRKGLAPLIATTVKHP